MHASTSERYGYEVPIILRPGELKGVKRVNIINRATLSAVYYL